MSIGTDPELFVMRKNRKKTASSIHLVKGFKDGLIGQDDSGAPHTFQEAFQDGKCTVGAILKRDGWALELNTAPSSCRDNIVPYTAATFRKFYKQFPGWKLSAIPVLPLDKASLKGDVPFGVNEFGCLPDYSAYTMEEKTPERQDYHNEMRYAGGHLHLSLLGWSKIGSNSEMRRDAKLFYAGLTALQMDVFIGIPLVAMLGEINDYGEEERRTYYGQAGSFRVTDYGLEYRVPSSAIMLSPILFAWALGACKFLTKSSQAEDQAPHELITKSIFGGGWHTLSGQLPQAVDKMIDLGQAFLDKFGAERVQHIINHHDVKEARAFLRETEMKGVYAPYFVKDMVRADDMEIPLNTDLYKSWQLDGNIRNHRYMGLLSLYTTDKAKKDKGENFGYISDEAFPAKELIKPHFKSWKMYG